MATAVHVRGVLPRHPRHGAARLGELSAREQRALAVALCDVVLARVVMAEER